MGGAVVACEDTRSTIIYCHIVACTMMKLVLSRSTIMQSPSRPLRLFSLIKQGFVEAGVEFMREGRGVQSMILEFQDHCDTEM